MPAHIEHMIARREGDDLVTLCGARFPHSPRGSSVPVPPITYQPDLVDCHACETLLCIPTDGVMIIGRSLLRPSWHLVYQDLPSTPVLRFPLDQALETGATLTHPEMCMSDDGDQYIDVRVYSMRSGALCAQFVRHRVDAPRRQTVPA